jgi:hypothetical protein
MHRDTEPRASPLRFPEAEALSCNQAQREVSQTGPKARAVCDRNATGLLEHEKESMFESEMCESTEATGCARHLLVSSHAFVWLPTLLR